MAELYDVIFYGVGNNSDDFDAVKQKIAALLKVKGPKLDALFVSQEGTTLRKGVPLALAQKYQQALVKAGGTCNYKPSAASGVQPELTPLEEDAAEADGQRFVYPACAYAMDLAENESAPLTCPACDIVPSKYEAVTKEKEERERVRRRLLSRHKTFQEQNEHEQALEAERAHQQQLEAEVLKELDLPGYLSSRGRLMSSASILLFIGIGVGILSVQAYQAFLGTSSEKEGKQLTANPLIANKMLEKIQNSAAIQNMQQMSGTMGPDAIMQQASGMMPPSQQAMLQLGNLAQQVTSGSLDINAATASATVRSGTATATPVPVSGHGYILASPAMHAESGSGTLEEPLSVDRDSGFTAQPGVGLHNPEWDLSQVALIKHLIQAGHLSPAYQVSQYITNPVWRYEWSGKIAVIFAQRSNIEASSMIWAKLRSEANKTRQMSQRIYYLCQLALFRLDASDPEAAKMLLQNAESLTRNMTVAEARAESIAYIASAQAHLGLDGLSSHNFKLANKLLADSTHTRARLVALAALADAYAKADQRGSALGILNQLLSLVRKINTDDTRVQLATRVAYTLAELGDLETAYRAADLIESTYHRDILLHQVLVEQLESDHLYQALNTADQLKTPMYQTLSQALLARVLEGTRMAGLARDRFERSIETSGYIIDSGERARVLSEMGRYQQRIGRIENARPLFSAALSLAATLSQTGRRQVLAHIARNQAQAGLIAEAMQTAASVQNKTLEEGLNEDILHLKKTNRILDSFKESLS